MSYYNTTPIAWNGFSVYNAGKFDERDVMGVQTAWQEFFPLTAPQYATDSAILSYDTIRGNRRMTQLYKRGANTGVSLDQAIKQDGKYTNSVRSFPLADEKSILSADDLLFRRAGESPTDSRSRMERARKQVSDNFAENTKKGIILNEHLASYAMQQGKQPVIIGETTDIIDYKRVSGNTIACTDEWDDTNAEPLTDLYGLAAQIYSTGKRWPDMAVFAPNSANALFSETSLQALADVRGFNFVQAGNVSMPPRFQKFVDGGFMYIGIIMLPQGITLYCFVDHGTYDNSSGTSTPYMTTATTLLCNSQTRYDLIIGPPHQLPMTDYERSYMENTLGISPDLELTPVNTSVRANVPGGFTHDIYFSTDRSYMVCRTQSSFVFNPVHTNSIGVLTGCAITS